MERKVVVAVKDGLHARPAALFVKAALQTGSEVTLGTGDGRTAPANSILAVMSLGVDCGQEVVLTSDDSSALDALEAVLTDENL